MSAVLAVGEIEGEGCMVDVRGVVVAIADISVNDSPEVICEVVLPERFSIRDDPRAFIDERPVVIDAESILVMTTLLSSAVVPTPGDTVGERLEVGASDKDISTVVPRVDPPLWLA
jgi:hypothetical protein